MRLANSSTWRISRSDPTAAMRSAGGDEVIASCPSLSIDARSPAWLLQVPVLSRRRSGLCTRGDFLRSPLPSCRAGGRLVWTRLARIPRTFPRARHHMPHSTAASDRPGLFAPVCSPRSIHPGLFAENNTTFLRIPTPPQCLVSVYQLCYVPL